jgi:hypothetical protein
LKPQGIEEEIDYEEGTIMFSCLQAPSYGKWNQFLW